MAWYRRNYTIPFSRRRRGGVNIFFSQILYFRRRREEVVVQDAIERVFHLADEAASYVRRAR